MKIPLLVAATFVALATAGPVENELKSRSCQSFGYRKSLPPMRKSDFQLAQVRTLGQSRGVVLLRSVPSQKTAGDRLAASAVTLTPAKTLRVWTQAPIGRLRN